MVCKHNIPIGCPIDKTSWFVSNKRRNRFDSSDDTNRRFRCFTVDDDKRVDRNVHFDVLNVDSTSKAGTVSPPYVVLLTFSFHRLSSTCARDNFFDRRAVILLN